MKKILIVEDRETTRLMVAETHSHRDDLSLEQVVAFVVEDLGRIDGGVDAAAVTLGECGFEMTLDIVELSQLLAEEFSERTLSSADLDHQDGRRWERRDGERAHGGVGQRTSNDTGPRSALLRV